MKAVFALLTCVQLYASVARSSALDDARGVTGPEPAPPAAGPVWTDARFWAAAVGVVAVIAAVLAGRRVQPPPAAEPLPAEWAAAELDSLARTDPDADALAAVLRGFLARRFHIPAAGTTTAELLPLLSAFPNVAAWQSLLERCDLARFANLNFTREDWTDIVDRASRLIAESLPVAEPADSAEAGRVGENA